VELRFIFHGDGVVVFEAQFFHLFDDVFVVSFIDVLEAALAGDCPAHDDAVLGVSCQITNKIILELGVDVFPHFKALDVVEGLSEVERSAEVSLLHVGSIGVGC
jgi:hypothetical protein